MDIAYLKSLTNKIGEWIPMYQVIGKDASTINQTDIHKLLTFVCEYEDVYIKFYNNTLWMAYSESYPSNIIPIKTEVFNDTDIIMDALELWDYEEIPYIAFDDVIDHDTGNTWMHVLAKKGCDKFLRKIYYTNKSLFLLLNKKNQTPYDVATNGTTKNMLRKLTTLAIEDYKRELRMDLETMKNQFLIITEKVKTFENKIQELSKVIPKTGFWENHTFSKIAVGVLGGAILASRFMS